MIRDNKRIKNILYASIAAFLTYSFMYAFRKPLTAATFTELELFGFDYKVIIVITQVFGYLSAKLLGIKVISELNNQTRRKLLVSLISISWLALFLFGITPFPYNFVWVFFNGFPLGLIWGIVFSYIEGRKSTDVLATFLSISFIFSSGVVKSLGRYLIEIMEISEFWMPFTVGVIFMPLIFISSWMLEKIPPPDKEDQHARTKREPLIANQRIALFKKFKIGLLAGLILNILLTIIRDLKDNFLIEIWNDFSSKVSPGTYALVESLVSVLILFLIAFVVLVKENKNALRMIHLIISLGLLLVIISTFLFETGSIPLLIWMVLHGVGLYLSYITFQSLYYERFIATFKISGNVGFFIYLADFLGYIGSVAILLIKEFIQIDLNWGNFFILITYIIGALGILSMIIAHFYFDKKAFLIKKP